MPSLESLWSEVRNQRDDVVVLCVNFGDPVELIRKYWAEEGFTLRAVRQNDDEISRAFRVSGYPSTYLLGSDGRVLHRSVGGDIERLRRLLLE